MSITNPDILKEALQYTFDRNAKAKGSESCQFAEQRGAQGPVRANSFRWPYAAPSRVRFEF